MSDEKQALDRPENDPGVDTPKRGAPVAFFLGLVFGVAPAVTLTFFGFGWFAENSTSLVTIVITALLGAASFGTILYLFGPALMKRWGLVGRTRLEEVFETGIKVVTSGDPGTHKEELQETARLALSWYAEIQTRRWIVASIIALVLAFGGLVTVSLLYHQNELFREQNEYLKLQNNTVVAQLKRQERDTNSQRADTLEALRLQAEANQQAQVQTQVFADQVAQAKSQQLLTEQQIEKQDEDTRIVRRAQLLTLIYELTDCDLEVEKAKAEAEFRNRYGFLEDSVLGLWTAAEYLKFGALIDFVRLHNNFWRYREHRDNFSVTQCPPRAPLRLRQEAVVALAGIDGRKLDLRSADLGEATLSGATLRDADLNKANLSYATLDGAILSNANLGGANLSFASLTNVDLSDADLSFANLINANLSGANLSGADLGGAYFSGATLRGVNFNNASLVGVNLVNADLSNANLTGAKHLAVDLDDACGDSETQIPENLRRPEHWLDRPAGLKKLPDRKCALRGKL